MTRNEIHINDRITFRSPTRWGSPKLTRVVVDLDFYSRPMVRAHGYERFIVKRDEVLEIIPSRAA